MVPGFDYLMVPTVFLACSIRSGGAGFTATQANAHRCASKLASL